MEKREIVSRTLHEVKPNGSHSTGKPSTVTMAIERRFSVDAYGHYLDMKEGIEVPTGLKGFELVAVYEDGLPEPDKAPEEIIIEEIEDKLDDVLEDEIDHCRDCGVEIVGDFYKLTVDNFRVCNACADKRAKTETAEDGTDIKDE